LQPQTIEVIERARRQQVPHASGATIHERDAKRVQPRQRSGLDEELHGVTVVIAVPAAPGIAEDDAPLCRSAGKMPV
jgi:hypothetical protein